MDRVEGGPSGPAADGSPVAVVLVTAASAGDLEALGETLVGERLAACVTVVPGVTSVYRWDEAVETASEALGIIKTTEVNRVARRTMAGNANVPVQYGTSGCISN